MSGLGFSAPWLLLAMLAVAAPIAAHLARHEDREGRGFPSLMFLRRVPFPTRSRRKLADRALLVLRVLAVAALVLAFAQPYLRIDDPQAGLPQRARVVLLDRSYSMGIGERFERARRAAQQALSVSDDSTRVALVVFDASATTLSGFAAGSSAALQALRSVQAGNRGTDLGKALTHASRLLDNSLLAQRELVLISDLQRSGVGADLELASDIELQVQRIGEAAPGNIALLGASYEEGEGAPETVGALHLRIANTGGEPLASSLRVEIDGLRAAGQQVDLPPGARRELRVPVFAARDRPTRVHVLLDDDPLAIDNARYLVIAPARPIKVLWIGGSPSGNAYVNAAVAAAPQPRPAATRAQSPALVGERSMAMRGARVRIQSVDVTQIDTRQLDGADAIVLDGVIPGDAKIADALARRIAQGAGLLSLMGGAMPAFTQLSAPRPAPGSGGTPAWIGGPLASVVAGVPGAPQRPGASATALAALAPEHALAAALGEASLSGIAVWRYQPFEPTRDDRVLARFADGSPALLERDHGLGRSLTLALSLQPQSSDFVLDPVFVPWLLESLVYLSQRSDARVEYAPGDVLDALRYADALAGGDAFALALRAGRAVQLRVPSGAAQPITAQQSPLLDETGFYELRVADAAPLPIAVNPLATESLLEAMTLEQFLARIHRGVALANPVPDGGAVEPRDTRIARWLLWLAIVALLGEAAFGAWLARRRVVAQQPA